MIYLDSQTFVRNEIQHFRLSSFPIDYLVNIPFNPIAYMVTVPAYRGIVPAILYICHGLSVSLILARYRRVWQVYSVHLTL
jgi:hypothetical protein